MIYSKTNKNGILKKKSVMDLLTRKVELRKELIKLKKLHENETRQKELLESIISIDEFTGRRYAIARPSPTTSIDAFYYSFLSRIIHKLRVPSLVC